MADMNKVMLMGFVSTHIDVGYIGGDENRPACRFGMGTHERYTDDTNEVQTITTWHSICFYGKTVNFIKEYIDKGDNIFVEGKLRVRTWEKSDGTMATAYEIVGDTVEILRKKAKNEETPNQAEEDSNMPY